MVLTVVIPIVSQSSTISKISTAHLYYSCDGFFSEASSEVYCIQQFLLHLFSLLPSVSFQVTP